MSELISGIPSRLIPFLPDAVDIVSSTNASPIEVTTDGAHHVKTGDHFVVEGHAHDAANGSWKALVTSPTTLKLVDSVGTTTGGATGTLRSAAFGSRITSLTDNDKPRAITWATTHEGFADRTALTFFQLHYDNDIWAGGRYVFHQRSTLNLNGLVNVGDTCELACEEGSEITGHLKLGGILEVRGVGTIQLNADSLINADDGAHINGLLDLGTGASLATGVLTVTNHSTISIADGGQILFAAGGEIGGTAKLRAGATLNVDGNIDIRSGAVADVSGTLNINGPGTFHIQNGATVNVDETMIFGATNYARIDMNTAVGGRVTKHFRSIDGESGGTHNHAISQGTRIHITGELAGVVNRINLSRTGAEQGDTIEILSQQEVEGGASVIVEDEGTERVTCFGGGGRTFGCIMSFGGSGWRVLLANTGTSSEHINEIPS